MIAPIIEALTSRLAGPAATVAAVVLAGVAVSQCSEKNAEARRADKAESARDLAQANLSTCRSNGAALEASLKGQNDALDAFRREGEARGAEVARARQAAAKEAERADRAAATLAKLKPAGVDLCARMLAVDEAVKEIGR